MSLAEKMPCQNKVFVRILLRKKKSERKKRRVIGQKSGINFCEEGGFAGGLR